MIIDGGLFEKIVISVLNVKTYSDLQKEAVWAVMNATTDGNEKQAVQVGRNTPYQCIYVSIYQCTFSMHCINTSYQHSSNPRCQYTH